jgi:hypothetical protein
MGLIVLITSLIIYIKYKKLPDCIILQDTEGCLYLPYGVAVKISDIIDVSYKKASAKGIQYKWGAIILTTRTARYKYGYVADCEDVSKMLTDMMYNYRYNDSLKG